MGSKKNIFLRLGWLYLLTIIVLLLSLNRFQLQVAQIDDLQEFGSYPVDYLSRWVDFNEQKVRYCRRYFEKFIKLIARNHDGMMTDPATLSRGYAMLAWCDYYLGRYQQSVDLYKKALKIEPKNFWIQYNLGVLYYRMGLYQEAIASFRPCLFINESKIVEVMELDYWKLWDKRMATSYRSVCLRQYHDMVTNAYFYSILAHDRLHQAGEVRNLALAAVSLGYDKKKPLFYQYAKSHQPIIEKPILSKDLMISPSQYFVKLGQEKYLVER